MLKSCCVNCCFQGVPKRLLHLQEWQGKTLLQKFGVPVQQFQCVDNDTLGSIDAALKWPLVVIKAQCEAGGRGRGTFMHNSQLRGIELLPRPTRSRLTETVKSMLNDRLVTEQTGKDGVSIDKVMLAEGINDIGDENYVALTLDRASKDIVLLISKHGGMSVEDHPDDVLKIPITSNPDFAKISKLLGVPDKQCTDFIDRLLAAFSSSDATLIEVNPLSFHNNRLLAIDAKITIDDNSLFRHSEFATNASQHNYIKLEGGERRVGCMVNGAGLAMATMDLLGPIAANFLDIGGAATMENIKDNLLNIASDPRVDTILINVFGGIVRCDQVAMGVKAALLEPGFGARLQRIVVRLTGNNAEKGLAMLNGTPRIYPCSELLKAAQLASSSSSSSSPSRLRCNVQIA